jgi:ATP-dependent Clp protease ATP-binding subunit ClpC
LGEDEILSIVDIMIARIETQLRNKDMGLELTDNAKKWLARKGYDAVLGARPLRRTIQREIEDPLSERILSGELRPGQSVHVDCDGDPADAEYARLIVRGVGKRTLVPDAVPAELGSTRPSGPGRTSGYTPGRRPS